MGAGRLISLDRQVAEDPTMNIAEQMLDVLACVVRRLADSGARPSHILSVRIDLAEASGYEDAMRVWAAWARAERVAARATVGPLEEKRSALVEVTVVAAFTPDRPEQH
jgi:enamine deaminase RidA (YjgF/YER057c/UK114 family)